MKPHYTVVLLKQAADRARGAFALRKAFGLSVGEAADITTAPIPVGGRWVRTLPEVEASAAAFILKAWGFEVELRRA